MNLFAVTAPLTIRLPGGGRHLLAERFPHPRGLLYFEPFWHQEATDRAIHLIEGTITGDGPWKIGDCVITLTGCHGSDPASSMEWARWQEYLQIYPHDYPTDDAIRATARRCGADV